MSQASTSLIAFISGAVFALIFGVQIVLSKTNVVLPAVLYNNLTKTSRIDNYVFQNQRQYRDEYWILDMHLTNFRTDYYGRIETIDYHVDLLDFKLHKVDNEIIPLALLDDVTNYCVLKYRNKLPNLEIVKTRLFACNQKAKEAFEPLIAPADITRRKLKSYYDIESANQLKDCKNKFARLEVVDYNNCVVAAIKDYNTVTASYINMFYNQLNNARCLAISKVKETFDCYATVVEETFSILGEVVGLVENCKAGNEFCPPCESTATTTTNTTTSQTPCPYQLNWNLSDITSEKINNPFRRINKSIPCLQFNFIPNAVVSLPSKYRN